MSSFYDSAAEARELFNHEKIRNQALLYPIKTTRFCAEFTCLCIKMNEMVLCFIVLRYEFVFN